MNTDSIRNAELTKLSQQAGYHARETSLSSDRILLRHNLQKAGFTATAQNLNSIWNFATDQAKEHGGHYLAVIDEVNKTLVRKIRNPEDKSALTGLLEKGLTLQAS